MGEIPVIQTERLTMRGHRLDDFEDSAAMWASPDVTRHIGGKPSNREESWGRFLRFAGLWQFVGIGYWAVRETASGRWVGEVGFADFKRELEPSIDGVPEMGWVLAPWAHGKGFASEAVRGAIGWHERTFGKTRLVCIIDPGNAPSIRVAQKAGFRKVVDTTYKGGATILFERL